jgi:predicted DNA-binding protein
METKFSKKQKKERQVSFRIQEELYEWLEAISKKEKKTKTQYIIDLLAKEWSKK